MLVVEDTGPGIADPALLDRGRSGGASTGLGLDIVRRTAEAAGGRLDLAAARPSGLRAVVWLGPPPDRGPAETSVVVPAAGAGVVVVVAAGPELSSSSSPPPWPEPELSSSPPRPLSSPPLVVLAEPVGVAGRSPRPWSAVPSSSPLCRPLVALAEPLGRGVAGRSPRPWSAVPSSSPPRVAPGELVGVAGRSPRPWSAVPSSSTPGAEVLLAGRVGVSSTPGPEAAATPMPVPTIAVAASAVIHVLRASAMSVSWVAVCGPAVGDHVRRGRAKPTPAGPQERDKFRG